MRIRTSRLATAAAVITSAAILVAGFDLATYAATGDSLLLGKINKSGTTTTVNNLGRGPVLNLIGGKPYPPLKVNSNKKVANFNADLVDGLDSTVLEPGITRVLMAAKGSTPPSTPEFHRISLPAGIYQVSISGIARNPTQSDSGTITCLLADQETVFANPSNPNYAGLVADQAELANVYGGFALFTGSGLLTLPAGHHVVYACSSNATTGQVVVESPMIATLRKVRKVTTVTGPVWTPPLPRTAARLGR